jgi:hypothetical protein
MSCRLTKRKANKKSFAELPGFLSVKFFLVKRRRTFCST